MKREIRLYWWKPREEGQINLGDEINRPVVKYASGRRVSRANLIHCDMIAIGSVLNFPFDQDVFKPRKRPMHVWGSGLIEGEKIPREPDLVYTAVCGPLTRCLVPDVPSSLPLGDPGILVPKIWEPAKEKRFAWGIIPHRSHINSAYLRSVQETTPNAAIVNFSNPDIKRTHLNLSSYERVLSTSLHRLIITASYKIPSIWMKTRDVHRGKSWKFYDYFASVGRTSYGPFDTKTMTGLRSIPDEAFCTAHFRNIASLAERLLAAFPRDSIVA
jgi:hypothetical protein